MLEHIQKSVKNYLDAVDLTDLTYGEVTSIEPLKIKLDQKIELLEQVLLLTSNVIYKAINTGTKQIVITQALKKGDKVMLLKVKNGQRYIVLDRLQEGG